MSKNFPHESFGKSKALTRASTRLRKAGAAVLAATTALVILTSGVSPATAAAPASIVGVSTATGNSMPVTTATPAALPTAADVTVTARVAVPLRSSIPWYKRWGAFAGCIFSVGIPIGAAIGLFQGSVAAYIAGQASRPLAASIGGAAAKYLDYAAWACRTAMYR